MHLRTRISLNGEITRVREPRSRLTRLMGSFLSMERDAVTLGKSGITADSHRQSSFPRNRSRSPLGEILGRIIDRYL